VGLVLLEGPTEPLVTTEEAQLHVRSDAAEEATYLADLVTAATGQAEAFCRRRFLTQRGRLTRDSFPDQAIALPYPPLASVEAVQYVDGDGAWQTVDAADYLLRTAETPGEVVPAYGTSWPSARSTKDAVRIDFTCGYGAAEDVPQGIKRAVLLIVGSLYANRESVAPVTMSEIPQSATWMLSPFRVWRF
jgi:uncharacterized phiE125 gp8 family phage protein